MCRQHFDVNAGKCLACAGSKEGKGANLASPGCLVFLVGAAIWAGAFFISGGSNAPIALFFGYVGVAGVVIGLILVGLGFLVALFTE